MTSRDLRDPLLAIIVCAAVAYLLSVVLLLAGCVAINHTEVYVSHPVEVRTEARDVTVSAEVGP